MRMPQLSTPDALKAKPSLSSLRLPDLKRLRLPDLKSINVTDVMNLNFARPGGSVVGLDIQPGFIAAAQGRGSGSVMVEKAAAMSLPPDTLHHGEVNDEAGLAEALKELFGESGLTKRVRVGIANQRTVLRTLELPPVTDAKELAAAVNFQAQEQVPMPLNNAVLDFHPLGVIDTPAGPRQRVVLVAAQRDMIERLLGAIEQAGLIPVGIDLSAFALIRSLYAPEPRAEGEENGETPRVLYLNVDGLTNLAIAEGPVCRFTRVVAGGIESMAAELAAKREISTPEARALLFAANLADAPNGDEWGPALAEQPVPAEAPAAPVAEQQPAPGEGVEPMDLQEPAAAPAGEAVPSDFQVPQAPEGGDPEQQAGGYEGEEQASYDDSYGDGGFGSDDDDVYGVLESGIRDIYGEVRNSLDFHRSQEGGGDVSQVVLSGAAQDIPGFADALQAALGIEVKQREVQVASGAGGEVSAHRLAVAAGLAVEEVSR